MDSLEALKKIRTTSKDLEASAQLLQMAAQAMEETSVAADWLSLQPVLRQAKVIALKIGLDGQVESAFGGLTEALGWHEGEFSEKNLVDMLDPSVEYSEQASPLGWLGGEEMPPSFHQPLAFLHRSGWRVWLDLTLVLQRGGGGAPLYYRGTAFDITPWHQRIQELEQELAEREELLAEAAPASEEEVCEPEVDLWTSVGERQHTILLAGMGRLTRLLQDHQRAAELAGLDWAVSWLSEVTRLQHEPDGWRSTRTFAPRLEVERAAALFPSVDGSRSICDQIEVGADIPEQMTGNVRALRTALVEVMEWASRTLPDGGVGVNVTMSEKGNFLVVFKCYGIVTEIGERAEQSLELQDLSTCRRFLKVLGGRLRVDRFLDGVEVQISLKAPAATTEQAPQPRSAPGHGLSILLAEDDEISRKVAVRSLKQMGHNVDSVTTGLEVLQAVTEHDYDVVLLDVQMPDMDGVEAARQLRRRFFPCPYIIALTSGTSAAERRRVMEAGMHDFIAKPFKADDMRDALSQVPLYSALLGRSSEG